MYSGYLMHYRVIISHVSPAYNPLARANCVQVDKDSFANRMVIVYRTDSQIHWYFVRTDWI